MRYEALFLIGCGAMAEIWVGRQRGPGGFARPVVLKRALSSAALPDALDPEASLLGEAHLLSLISHPNVVGVIDLAKTPDGLVLVLELVRGVSLRSWLSRLAGEHRVLSVGRTARLLADAARGLDAAQAASDMYGRPARIVHRDVSPENLMVGEHGIVKLIDFGVARTALRERTVVPMIKGKLPYLSPEQVEGRDIDWRSDVFALGAVLYEMLTGRRLFAAREASDVLDAIVRARVSDLPNDAPAELRGLFRRMTALDPRARPSLGEIGAALETLATAEGVGHTQVASALRADMGPSLDALRARIRDVSTEEVTPSEHAPTDIDMSVASAIDAWAATEPAATPTKREAR